MEKPRPTPKPKARGPTLLAVTSTFRDGTTTTSTFRDGITTTVIRKGTGKGKATSAHHGVRPSLSYSKGKGKTNADLDLDRDDSDSTDSESFSRCSVTPLYPSSEATSDSD